MKNCIRHIKTLNTQYSKIIVEQHPEPQCNRVISEHIVSNQGNYPLAYWINYFTNEF